MANSGIARDVYVIPRACIFASPVRRNASFAAVANDPKQAI